MNGDLEKYRDAVLAKLTFIEPESAFFGAKQLVDSIPLVVFSDGCEQADGLTAKREAMAVRLYESFVAEKFKEWQQRFADPDAEKERIESIMAELDGWAKTAATTFYAPEPKPVKNGVDVFSVTEKVLSEDEWKGLVDAKLASYVGQRCRCTQCGTIGEVNSENPFWMKHACDSVWIVYVCQSNTCGHPVELSHYNFSAHAWDDRYEWKVKPWQP